MMLTRTIGIVLLSFCLQLSFSQQTKSALFLGNSYTYYNNMPMLVDNLALAMGNDLIYDSNTPGGYQLYQHASNATSLSKIDQGDWDYVVIQAQSQEPSFSPGQVAANTYPHAATLNDSILSSNPCTEPLFYMTWGRKNGDASNCGNYPPICTYDGMQQRLKESYLEMADDNDASVAPVGVAWKAVRDLYPTIELYNPDESHPSAAGSYLAACVFNVSIFRESIVNNSFEFTLDSLTAYRLRDIASSTVLDSLSVWGIGNNDLSISLGNDTALCADSVWINTNGTYENLLWSTGTARNIALISSSGPTWVRASNVRNCMVSDTIEVALNTGSITTQHYEACDSFILDSVVYFDDSTIVKYFALANGCDSILIYEIEVDHSPEIFYDFMEVDFQNDILYVPSEDFDSTFILNTISNDSAINQDTMFYACQFYGFVLAWNSCGMDSVVVHTNCGSIDELDQHWNLYPVPSRKFLQIENNLNQGFGVQLFDLKGRLILNTSYSTNSVQIVNLDDLARNNYFLIVLDEAGKIIGKKTIQKQ